MSRELDAEVAEHVLGLPVRWREDPYREIGMPAKEGRQPWLKGHAAGVEYDWASVPRYSTDLAAAWRVVEHLERRGFWCQMRTPFDDREGCYWAGFTPHGVAGWNGKPDNWTNAQTLPRAICLAALRVARPERGEERP